MESLYGRARAFVALFDITCGIDLLHWSLGVRLEIPRPTKHNYHLYVIKLRALCFGIAFSRRNTERVARVTPGTVGRGTPVN